MVITPIIIALSAVAATLARGEHLRGEQKEIQEHFLRMILLGDPLSERYIDELAQYASSRTKRIAAEVLANLAPIIYKVEAQYIETIAQRLKLDKFLIAQCKHSRGAHQRHYLLIISRLPLHQIHLEEMQPYLTSKSRMTRFFALLAVINIDKGNFLQHLAAYPSTLTPFERSQLLSMLCLGGITVAYQPMLSSHNTNVQLLGITVVQHFGIKEAEAQLREIISKCNDLTLRMESLFAIASMHLLLCTPSILHFVKSLPRASRRRFLRHITYEGYSLKTINFFIDRVEAPYYQSLINSYKVKI